MASSYWYLGHLDLDSSLIVLRAWLFIGGFGSGLAMMPPSIVAMNAVKTRQVSDASGLNSVTRQVAAAMGTAALASVFVGIRPPGDLTDPAMATEAISAFNTIFMVCFVLLVLCAAVGLLLPGRTVALALQADRRAELDAMTTPTPAGTTIEPGRYDDSDFDESDFTVSAH